MRSAKRWLPALAGMTIAALLLAGCAEEPKKAPGPARPAAVAGKGAKKPAKAAAPAVKPLTPDERYAQALAQMKSNDLAGAEANLKVSIKDFPDKTGPHANLGIVYAKTNRKAEAAAEFTQAVTLSSRNALAHNWLGVLARERGDYVRAEQWYKQALAADSSYADAQLNLAILYDKYLKRPVDALEAYKRYDKLTSGKDLRAAVWVAQIQADLPAPLPAATQVPAPAQPAKVQSPAPQPAPTKASPAKAPSGAKS